MKWGELPDGEYGSYREHAPVGRLDRIEFFDGRSVVVSKVNVFGVPVTDTGRHVGEQFRVVFRWTATPEFPEGV